MDIYCPRCTEPWDTDSIHEIAEDQDVPYNEAVALFRKHGCTVLGSRHNDDFDPARAELIGMMMDLSGHDVDGMAADLADFGI